MMTNLPPFESFINHNNNNINLIKAENVYSHFNSEDSNSNCNNIKSDNKSATQYFWNYNACNKGPKKRCVSNIRDNCPHSSTFDYTDPIKVKSPCGKIVRHRKSDTTGTTPNLLNFQKIRNKFIKLTSEYKETIQKEGKMSPKVRNILSSKICRLKKKAYHESLKIKYSALGVEYTEIMNLINLIEKHKQNCSLVKINKIQNKYNNVAKAAGRLDDYINDLLVAMENRDFQNPSILKLNHLNSDVNVSPIHSESNDLIDIEEEFNFLFDDGVFYDFLNSSGSTTFTDELYNY